MLTFLNVGAARQLAPDEQVLFIPDTARLSDDQHIQLRIEAWVYELERRPGLSALLARYLDLELDQLATADRERFYARTQLFRVDSESRKQLSVAIQLECAAAPSRCSTFELPRSNLAGRSSATVDLHTTEALADGDWIDYSLRMPHGDLRNFAGRVQWLAPEGLSVISDIDDTIKHTQVRDRRQMLRNTFVHEFTAVPGMASRYQQLALRNGARFHYLSSSPIQLYPPLARFLEDQGFPLGSVHLRESTSFAKVIPGKNAARNHKLAAIQRLLNDFPQRRFLLIGDSGESDPEIYGDIARRNPAQIAGIRIRNVSDEDALAARYQQSFRKLPASLWQVFEDADTLRAPRSASNPAHSLRSGLPASS